MARIASLGGKIGWSLVKRGGHGGEQNRVGPECNQEGGGIALCQEELA